jgi:twitching motility protein PilT
MVPSVPDPLSSTFMLTVPPIVNWRAGRVAALEILINTPAVSNLIRQGKLDQLETAMQAGGGLGMQSMDTALMDLVTKGVISGKDAYLQANNKSKFERMKDEA